MALKSDLFTKPPNDKLNKCSVSDPNHIFQGVNDQGDHVGRIQTALLRMRDSDPSLELPPIGFEELANQKYGPKTAACVLQYKKKRAIIRPGQRLDNIVGTGTIASLDRDMVKFQNRPSVPNLPIPPIDPTPVPANSARRIIVRKFRKTDAANPFLNPNGNDSKEAADALRDLLFETLAPSSTLLPFEIGPSQIASLPANHRVNQVTTAVDVDVSLLKFGGGVMTITTTIITYDWGPPMPNVTLVKTEQVKVFDDQKPPFTQTSSLPRAAAEKTPLVVPPNPP